MEKKKQTTYNFNSVDLLIYIWKKRIIFIIVGFVAAITSIVISLTITPMFEASVIMFPSSSADISKSLMIPSYTSRQGLHGFGEEDEAEQLLQVLHSEPIRTRIIEEYNLMEHYEIDPEGKFPRTELLKTYRSNFHFRLTEYMAVEISVMDKDPELAAEMANNISNLVDTVYNGMKKDREKEALRLVEREYRKADAGLEHLKDSLTMMTDQVSEEVKRSGDAADKLAEAFAENASLYMSTLFEIRTEISVVASLQLRYQEARLQAEQDLPYKFVVEKAVPPEKKAYPNKSLIVIVSTFSALLLALIVLIVIDNIKERVGTKEEE
jgi:uncharacterized protein involved in exopolysaccharide biosynthesis